MVGLPREECHRIAWDNGVKKRLGQLLQGLSRMTTVRRKVLGQWAWNFLGKWRLGIPWK